MQIFTNAKISPAGSVNKADLKNWGKNLVVFLAPLGLVYLGQLTAGLQNGALKLQDFVPTLVTIGAVELYIVNALTDLLRKFTDSNR